MNRQLDILVAKTLGWTKFFDKGERELGMPPNVKHLTDIPEYSSDIRAAWEITLEARKDGWYVAVAEGYKFTRALFQRDTPKHWDLETMWVGLDADKTMDATTTPLAICLAFLKAKGVPQEEIDAVMK